MVINQNPGLNKSETVLASIKNADTVVIPVGSPVILAMNGTNDGLAVVLPSTAGSLAKIVGFGFGVATTTMQIADLGNSVVFGMCYSLLIQLISRATTNSWATYNALSVGQFLSIDSVNNQFVTAATTTAESPFMAVIAQTLAAGAGTASSTADSRTAITALIQAFVRVM